MDSNTGIDSDRKNSLRVKKDFIDYTKLPIAQKRFLMNHYGNRNTMNEGKVLTAAELARKFGVTYLTARKWKNCQGSTTRKKRQGNYKITNKMKLYIKKEAGNKLTLSENASIENIRQKVINKFGNKYFIKTGKELSISHECIRLQMNKVLTKPRKLKKSFVLTENHVLLRKEFCENLLNQKDFDFNNILFTDEKKFQLHRHINLGCNLIRLTK